MNLNEAYEFLNFLINKFQGSWYPPDELDLVVDRAQMGLFNDYYQAFSSGQRMNDALSPFKRRFLFTNITSPVGLITRPADYEHLLTIYTTVINPVLGTPQNRPVPILNEDEKVARDNSQIYPPTLYDPYALLVQDSDIQLYPAVPQAGTMVYLSRPVAPFFAYSLVSGRVIVYDPINSVQLAWNDKDMVSILVKALNFLGINLSEADILAYSEQKDQMNINSPKMKL